MKLTLYYRRLFSQVLFHQRFLRDLLKLKTKLIIDYHTVREISCGKHSIGLLSFAVFDVTTNIFSRKKQEAQKQQAELGFMKGYFGVCIRVNLIYLGYLNTSVKTSHLYLLNRWNN